MLDEEALRDLLGEINFHKWELASNGDHATSFLLDSLGGKLAKILGSEGYQTLREAKQRSQSGWYAK